MISRRSIAMLMAGALTGVGVSLFVAAVRGGDPWVEEAPRARDPDTPRDRAGVRADLRYDWRVFGNARKADTAPTPSADMDPPPPGASPEVTPIEAHAAAIARHMDSPMDLRWARASEESISSSLERLAARSGFSVANVECRSTSCLAEVGWADYRAALSSYESLLVEAYEPNCATEITLPDPIDHGATYGATLVLDCSGSR